MYILLTTVSLVTSSTLTGKHVLLLLICMLSVNTLLKLLYITIILYVSVLSVKEINVNNNNKEQW